jgi:hypothetical protein
MTDAMSSPPKIESGKTLDLGRRRGAFPYLLADRRGRPGWMTYSGLVSIVSQELGEMYVSQRPLSEPSFNTSTRQNRSTFSLITNIGAGERRRALSNTAQLHLPCLATGVAGGFQHQPAGGLDPRDRWDR